MKFSEINILWFPILGVALATLTQFTDYAIWASTLLVFYSLVALVIYALAIFGVLIATSTVKDVNNAALPHPPFWIPCILSVINLSIIAYIINVLINMGNFGVIIGGIFITTITIFYALFINYQLLIRRHRKHKDTNMVE